MHKHKHTHKWYCKPTVFRKENRLIKLAESIKWKYIPVIGGLRNVVSGSAKYTIEISSTVSPMLCMWMVRYGNKEAVARAVTISQ